MCNKFRYFVVTALLAGALSPVTVETKEVSAKTRLIGVVAPALGVVACGGIVMYGDKIARTAVIPCIKNCIIPFTLWVAEFARAHPRFALGCGALIAARNYVGPWALVGIDAAHVLWSGDTGPIETKREMLKKQITTMAKLFGDILRVREFLLTMVKPEHQRYLHKEVFTDIKLSYRKRFKRSLIKLVTIGDMLKKSQKKYVTLATLKDGIVDHYWSPLCATASASLLWGLDDKNFITNYGGGSLVEALQKLVTSAEEIKGLSTAPIASTVNINQINNNAPILKKKNHEQEHLKEFANQARQVRDLLGPLYNKLLDATERLKTVEKWLA